MLKILLYHHNAYFKSKNLSWGIKRESECMWQNDLVRLGRRMEGQAGREEEK